MDVIKDDFKVLSNPIVVDDYAYMIGVDGLLYRSDGVSVNEVGSSFDLTKFDDFDENKPVWLSYSSKLKSLLVHRRAATAPHYGYMINLEDGSVAQIALEEIEGVGGSATQTTATIPRSFIGIEQSTDNRILASHCPIDGDTDKVVVAELSLGDVIGGSDLIGTNTKYWNADIQSGQLFITNEGEKATIKHVIVNTYADTDTTPPDVMVMVKSLEDSSWYDKGDTTGTIAATTGTTWVGTGTAWSNLIGRAGTEVDGVETKFVLPCLAKKARVYLESGSTYTLQTAGTDYTIDPDGDNVKEIGFTAAPANTKNLYAFWDSEPEVVVAVGDYIETDEGFHRITAINTATSITVDHGLDSGTSTGTHHPAAQMGDGDSTIKLGINKLVEGCQIRIVVVPRGGTGAPSVVKITGISIGYIPAGKKILEATGS